MIKIKDIIDTIESFAPLSTQAPYDNCGLKIGDVNEEIRGITVTLDTNPEVVREAEEKGCNLIVEHHPSIWHGWKTLDTNYPKVRSLLEAYRKRIAVYSAHTNIDFAVGGLNDYFAEQIGVTDLEVLPEGRAGKLKNPCSLREYAETIAAVIGDTRIGVIGEPNKTIEKVAVINGAGGGDEELLYRLFADGCDVFVTAEVKYNVARLSKDCGYAIIEVGHYTSEKGFMPFLCDLLQKKWPSVPVYPTEVLQNPYL